MKSISFIVIGRNEGSKLSRCLQSIFNTIRSNKIEQTEVIYVDSNSTDDSIERAQKFYQTTIIKLTEDYNAAIARNIGAKKSSGDILFFIDGDMEIQSNFLPYILNKSQTLIYPFISGQFINYFYNKEGVLIQKSNYDKSILSGDRLKTVTGGLFIIERKYWILVNGMKIKFKMGEDIDFGLRLAKKGLKLLRKREVLAIHHTISYKDTKRMWTMLLRSKAGLYSRSLLYRNHLCNKHIYPIIIRNDYSLICLIISSSLSFINPVFLLLYLFIIIVRSLKSSKFNILKLVNLTVYYFLRDFMVFLGFFFFFPKSNYNVEYQLI